MSIEAKVKSSAIMPVKDRAFIEVEWKWDTNPNAILSANLGQTYKKVRVLSSAIQWEDGTAASIPVGFKVGKSSIETSSLTAPANGTLLAILECEVS